MDAAERAREPFSVCIFRDEEISFIASDSNTRRENRAHYPAVRRCGTVGSLGHRVVDGFEYGTSTETVEHDVSRSRTFLLGNEPAACWQCFSNR